MESRHFRKRVPSPAIAFVGKHNSGKTTLIEGVIAELVKRGYDVGSVKHHSHNEFDIDVPGKDSYRHKAAGANDVVIASPIKMARIKDLQCELPVEEIVEDMPGHDIIIVEGYKKSSLPMINVTEDVRLDPIEIADYIVDNYIREKICLVIQAGGESKRMGSPKEMLKFHGRYVIDMLIDRFSYIVDEVLITCNNPENLQYIKDKNYSIPVKVMRDLVPKQGALSGVYTGFALTLTPLVAMIACDMIFASPDLLLEQIKIMQRDKCDVVIPVNKNGREPFHALYRRVPCLLAADIAFDAGEKRAQSFLDVNDLEIHEMTQQDVRKVVPLGGCFINVNTPEELAKFDH